MQRFELHGDLLIVKASIVARNMKKIRENVIERRNILFLHNNHLNTLGKYQIITFSMKISIFC